MEEVKVVSLTVKQAKVLEILKEVGEPMFAQEIADAGADAFPKAAKSVSPLMTHLVKAGYVAKDKGITTAVNKEGVSVSKELTRYWVTEAGAELVYQIRQG